MANETAQVKPANSICYNTKNISYETKKVETATNVYPGRLVKKGTNDDDIVVNSAGGAAIGWAGYEQTSKRYRPATVDTIYAANAQITVIHGPGIGVVASLASGENVAKGAILKAAANGEVAAAVAGTDDVIAVADESLDQSGGGSGDIMVRSRI
jgi:hypothetical protein